MSDLKFANLPGVAIRHRQAVEAKIVLACPACGAPGVYKSHPSIKEGWPGCYVKPGSPLDGKPVDRIQVYHNEASRGATWLRRLVGKVWPSPISPMTAPVGCPNCGAARPAMNDLGIIWHNGG